VWEERYTNPQDMISASSFAGGIAGGAGGILRMFFILLTASGYLTNNFLGGRRNIIPGIIMFTLFGAAGQALYNTADSRHSTYASQRLNASSKNTWLDSKWSPVSVLSDDEYESMLREKLLRVNAEIALIDDSIADLKIQEMKIIDGAAHSGQIRD
jgi:hypothetical protein